MEQQEWPTCPHCKSSRVEFISKMKRVFMSLGMGVMCFSFGIIFFPLLFVSVFFFATALVSIFFKGSYKCLDCKKTWHSNIIPANAK